MEADGAAVNLCHGGAGQRATARIGAQRLDVIVSERYANARSSASQRDALQGDGGVGKGVGRHRAIIANEVVGKGIEQRALVVGEHRGTRQIAFGTGVGLRECGQNVEANAITGRSGDEVRWIVAPGDATRRELPAYVIA